MGPLKGRIHPEGWPFIIFLAIVGALFFLFSAFWGLFFIVLTLCCAAFFREPLRVAPDDPSFILSPADGLLLEIKSAKPPAELMAYQEESWVRLSIFLSIFDVHVTRMPQKGRVLMTVYHKGKFLNASFDKASNLNERNSVVLETEDGTVIVTQIAGLIARRIVCYASIGDEVERGETFGVIRFGSRVDMYLPNGVSILVKKGQKIVGGETVIAKFA